MPPTTITIAAGALVILLAGWPLMPARGLEEHMEVANKQVTLADVCRNAQVPIISVAEALRLIEELERGSTDCGDYYKQSFFELKPILIDQGSIRERFNLTRDYHFKYINPKVETYKLGDDLEHLEKKPKYRPLNEDKVEYGVQLDDYKQEVMIPISLQHFFKAYMMQMSGQLKRAFVANLDEVNRLLSDHDFKILRGDALRKPPLASEASSAGQKSGQLVDSGSLSAPRGVSKFQYDLKFRQLVYMPELEGELEEGDIERSQETTELDLREYPAQNEFMHACTKRFRPVYSSLVLPIVRLAKLGYEYVGHKIDSIGDQLKSQDALMWMAITIACEASGKIRLVGQEPADMDELKFNPHYSFKIEDPLWIKGAVALAREFKRTNEAYGVGVNKFIRSVKQAFRKLGGAVDPHQFAWYRRNQNTLSSVLNTMSIASNVLSMVMSVASG
jgi:hypothetical protein